MTRAVWFWAVIATVLASFAVAATRGNSITIRVSTFRSLKGSLRCRLYSRPDGFPGKPPYEAEQSVAVSANSMTCTFPSVAAGTYAVALFHDENDDGKLDTNFVGIPREGVGVSNNKLRAFGPPTWNDAKFTLKSDLVLDVTLHY